MTPGCQHNLGQGHATELLASAKKRRREVTATSRTFREAGGPFPQTDQGNRYLVIAMDYSTQRPKVYADLENFTATKAGAWSLT
jgi:hypothetical protein